MGIINLATAMAGVYATEGRLPLASTRPTENDFTAFRTAPYGSVLVPNQATGAASVVYVNDGGDDVFSCAVEKRRSGRNWGEKRTPDLFWLRVPGLEGTLKLKFDKAEGWMEILHPTGNAPSEHFHPEHHIAARATRVDSWSPDLKFLERANVFAYRDDYDVHHVANLNYGRFLVIGKARWSHSEEPFRAYYADANGFRQQVDVRVESRRAGEVLTTQFGKIALPTEGLSDLDAADTAALLAGARLFAVSPETIQSRAALAQALGIDFAPPVLSARVLRRIPNAGLSSTERAGIRTP